MDGAARAFAGPVMIELGGKSYQVKGRIIDNWAMIEQKIIQDRPNPFLIAKENLRHFDDAPHVQRELLSLAMEEAKRARYVSREEAFAFLMTGDGMIFSLWLQIRENDPAFLTLEKVKQLIGDEIEKRRQAFGDAGIDAYLEGLRTKMAAAGGEDELGNSTGPS